MSAAVDPQLVDSKEFIDVLDYQFSGDNVTVERKRAFIEAYREEGSIYHAASASRVHRKTVYRWIETDPQFAQAVEESKEDCYDKAETSVFKKALNGDSLLLMFYLKAHRHKFRDKVTIDLESLRDEIQQRMAQLGLERLRQLQPTTSSFIDVSHAQTAQRTSNSHTSNPAQSLPVNSAQFPPQPDDQQKEE